MLGAGTGLEDSSENFGFRPKPVVVLFKVYLCHFTDSQSMTGGKRHRQS